MKSKKVQLSQALFSLVAGSVLLAAPIIVMGCTNSTGIPFSAVVGILRGTIAGDAATGATTIDITSMG